MNAASTWALRQALLRLLAGVVMVGCVAVQASEITSGVPDFDAAYKVRASVASGELSMSLRTLADGGYEFSTRTRPRGFVKLFARGEINERSRFVMEEGRLVPLDYTLRDTISDGHDAEYQFDWSEGVVFGIERGEPVSQALEKGLLNRAALYVALMRDLQQGSLPESYALIDRGRVKRYGVEILGQEEIDVPFGRFDTLKLVRDTEGSSRSMYLWCAPALNYLPVRIDLYKGDKRVSTAELKAVRGLPAT